MMGYIPEFIRHDPNLNSTTKLIYVEITSSLDKDGICKKNNAYFARVLGISKSTCSNSINKLRECGYISVIMIRDENQRFVRRYIALKAMFNISVGVKLGFDAPYAEILSEVEVGSDKSAEEKDVKAMSKIHDSIIINNNIINKTITNKPNKLDMDINKDQYNYLYGICAEFYEAKTKQYPESFKRPWAEDTKLINNSIAELYKLITFDGYDEITVRDVIRWAVDEKFWRSVLSSLGGLRRKANNGNTKFTNMYLKYKA